MNYNKRSLVVALLAALASHSAMARMQTPLTYTQPLADIELVTDEPVISIPPGDGANVDVVIHPTPPATGDYDLIVPAGVTVVDAVQRCDSPSRNTGEVSSRIDTMPECGNTIHLSDGACHARLYIDAKDYDRKAPYLAISLQRVGSNIDKIVPKKRVKVVIAEPAPYGHLLAVSGTQLNYCTRSQESLETPGGDLETVVRDAYVCEQAEPLEGTATDLKMYNTPTNTGIESPYQIKTLLALVDHDITQIDFAQYKGRFNPIGEPLPIPFAPLSQVEGFQFHPTTANLFVYGTPEEFGETGIYGCPVVKERKILDEIRHHLQKRFDPTYLEDLVTEPLIEQEACYPIEANIGDQTVAAKRLVLNPKASKAYVVGDEGVAVCDVKQQEREIVPPAPALVESPVSYSFAHCTIAQPFNFVWPVPADVIAYGNPVITPSGNYFFMGAVISENSNNTSKVIRCRINQCSGAFEQCGYVEGFNEAIDTPFNFEFSADGKTMLSHNTAGTSPMHQYRITRYGDLIDQGSVGGDLGDENVSAIAQY